MLLQGFTLPKLDMYEIICLIMRATAARGGAAGPSSAAAALRAAAGLLNGARGVLKLDFPSAF